MCLPPACIFGARLLADHGHAHAPRVAHVPVFPHVHALPGSEIAAPAAPATNEARLYAEDNGAGKTRLVVLFPTGIAQVLATEP